MHRVAHQGSRLHLQAMQQTQLLSSKAKKPGKPAVSQLEITEESDFAFRKDSIKQLETWEQDHKHYPVLVQSPSMRVPNFREKYASLKETLDCPTVLSGKISSIRKAGKGSMFVDIIQDNVKVQLIVNHKVMCMEKPDFIEHHSHFRPGDQIIAKGLPGVTMVGELSLKLKSPLVLASPSLHPLPPKLTDTAKINSNRVVDYLVNAKSKQVILTRSKVISNIRRFFEDKGFVEVETPIISSGNTGANATPFLTSSVHIKDNDQKLKELSLRVAPELWLKKMIISGFDQIFEISKVFRNEGVDSTHNPEFTTCEFYRTFTNLDDLMQITEELFLFIINDLKNNPKFEITHTKCQQLLDVIQNEGQGHFKKIDFINELESQTGSKLPAELTSESLIAYHEQIGLALPKILSENQLLDNLSSTYLEPLCGQLPTFIYNLPEILSPLAKSSLDSSKRPISNRFELYINGKEYVNAYEEENNPFKQELKFKSQLLQKDQFNDEESIIPDYKFVEFMEWGMPPTGGWGLGIDRLVMLLTESERIDNVLPFGKLPDVLKH